MINKYLLPIFDGESSYITHCTALNFSDAEDRFTTDISEEFDWDTNISDWDSFKEFALNHDVVIGDIYDIEEF